MLPALSILKHKIFFMNKKLIINTDGGARGNPGPSGIGVVIKNEKGMIVEERNEYIGEATNNCAEYKALILALLTAKEFNADYLHINMDSELVVRQMQGKYKIKEPSLKILAAEVLKLTNQFKQVDFHHVPREQNKEADKLVNRAIDEAGK
jgi:ribonuclease HI